MMKNRNPPLHTVFLNPKTHLKKPPFTNKLPTLYSKLFIFNIIRLQSKFLL